MIRTIVHHRAPILLLAVCTLLFGILSYAKLPRENNPDVKIPLVMVTTPYIGVSPEDVESLIPATSFSTGMVIKLDHHTRGKRGGGDQGSQDHQ